MLDKAKTYPEDLLKICQNINDKKYMISLGVNKELRSKIFESTAWIEKYHQNPSLKLCCALIKNNITEDNVPRCEKCGNVTSFGYAGWNRFCSDKCRRNGNVRLTKHAYECLNNRDWLYEQRIVLRKSIEAIAAELNCSVTPVNSSLKTYGIPKRRYNGSHEDALIYLEDKDWLYQEHVINRRPLHDIAEEIGSTKPTISVWLAKHNIKANDPNSYDRPKSKPSNQSREVINFVRDLLGPGKVEVNVRRIIPPYELDLIVPDKNIAIEYNGVFSHHYRPEETTFARRKDARYHLYKTTRAKEQGYDLIHIFSDDWIYRKDICKSIIQSKLGMSNKIFARKCEIVEVNRHEKSNFLNNNHIQGNDHASLCYGLLFEDELVAVMSFCKSRYNKSYEWELSRYCSILNTTIVGGFSRLLKHFENNHSGSIVSYADRSRSNGNVYLKNGFELEKINPPGYCYVNLDKSEQRMHRSNFTKKRISEPGDIRTEEEIMYSKGYVKIFDCGTLRFVRRRQ